MKNKKQNRRKQQGFSLIELLVVMAIILIIAAIAVPSLLRAKSSAQQTSAAANTRSVATAALIYFNTFQTYPANIASLAGTAPCTGSSSASACLLDPTFSATKQGYNFTVIGSATDFVANAMPIDTTLSPYCAGADGVVRRLAVGGTTVSTTATCQANPAI